jgi:hypothetical protein
MMRLRNTGINAPFSPHLACGGEAMIVKPLTTICAYTVCLFDTTVFSVLRSRSRSYTKIDRLRNTEL